MRPSFRKLSRFASVSAPAGNVTSWALDRIGTNAVHRYSQAMRITYPIWLAALAISLSPPAGAITDSRVEFWKNDAQGWVVEARECNNALCGFLVSYRTVHP